MDEKNIKIRNTQARILGMGNGVVVKPKGEVMISDAQYAELEKEDTFLSFCKLGWLRVSRPAVAEADRKDADLTGTEERVTDDDGLTVRDATEVIEDETDTILLLKWLQRADKQGVKMAIQARVAKLSD